MSLTTLAKVYITLQHRLSDGNQIHPLRQHITVEQAEKYNGYLNK